MSQQPINVGTAPNDGTGDPIRTAFQKTNANFADLQTQVTNATSLTLVAGPVTALTAGSPPTAGLTGTAPNYTLNLGLPVGPAGAGAPTSADILAIADRDDLMQTLAAAGVPDAPSLIMDFMRGIYSARKSYIGASFPALAAAIAGSNVTRASTATYFDSDGLLKSAAVNVPRFGYDPVTRLPLGLLIENAHTNLALRSQEIDNASWIKVSTTVSANASIAPDGTPTMDRLVEDTAAAAHYLQASMNVTSGTTYVLSTFGSEPTGNLSKRYLILLLPAAQFVSNCYAIFDLALGTVVSTSGPVTASIQNCGGGRYRCAIVATAGASAATAIQIRVSNASTGIATYTGDGVSGIDLWGAQFEAGPGPSSYIPTVASTVTRAADTDYLGVGQWHNPVEGTLLLEWVTSSIPTGATVTVGTLSAATADDSTRVYLSTSSIRAAVVASTVSQALMPAGTYAADAIGRYALGLKAANFASTYNANAIVAVASGTMPVSMIGLYLMSTVTLGNRMEGYLRRAIYYPVRLSDAKLQILANQSLWS